MATEVVGGAQWTDPAGTLPADAVPVMAWLVEIGENDYEVTTARALATHTHAVDPGSGDIVVVPISEAGSAYTSYIGRADTVTIGGI